MAEFCPTQKDASGPVADLWPPAADDLPVRIILI